MKFFLYFYFSFPFSFQKKFFVTENTIIPERLNIIVKKILIIILFSITPEARYEINIIKNSIKKSPPEKTYGKGKNLSLCEASVHLPAQRMYARSCRIEPLLICSPVNRLQNYSIIFFEKCQDFIDFFL